MLSSSFFAYNPLVYFWRYNYTGYAVWICKGKYEIANPNLQIDALLKEGVREKNIYRDVSSGAKAERHDLDLMIGKLREEDTVIVWKLDRIARSISHLLRLV
ncbi:MAG TPA: recombinase family protein, partial [Pricia sp.]|nr:recombinase family protein [Pricia sp.]